MLRIAIVEDSKKDLALLKECLKRFFKENNIEYVYQSYVSPLDFLTEYNNTYDIVFMDMDLPEINGLETARRLRQRDPNVLLLFVTIMAQYAVEGYSVDALDYIVKPVNYFSFALKMQRVMKYVEKNSSDDMIFLNVNRETVRVNVKDILYVEVDNHYLVYHTHDKKYKTLGTISEAEKKLPSNFCMATRYILINFKYVASVSANGVIVGTDEFIFSRGRKKEFIERFAVYSVGGNR